MKFEKGRKKTGGKKAGTENKTTRQFKEALNNLLELSAPKMIGWLNKVAEEDPKGALDHVGKLAEYIYPKLSRSDSNVKFSGKATLTVKPSGE